MVYCSELRVDFTKDFLKIETADFLTIHVCSASNYIHIGDQRTGGEPSITGVSQPEHQAETNLTTNIFQFTFDCA